jgi:hypothetical protein
VPPFFRTQKKAPIFGSFDSYVLVSIAKKSRALSILINGRQTLFAGLVDPVDGNALLFEAHPTIKRP